MKLQYVLLGAAILAALAFYAASAHAQGSIGPAGLASSINATESYINTVNQSGYLIFYPNLTQAYSYLSLAKNESQINSSYSYALLALARQSAQSQLASIYRYRTYSLYVLVVSSFFLAFLLYALMAQKGAGRSTAKSRK